MSEERPANGHRTVFELFAEVKREIGPVGKDSTNTQQNFKFRGVDAVVNAAAKALDKHGVIISPRVDKYTYGTVEVGQKRTPMAHVQVQVTYTAYGPGGDSFPMATVPGEAMDSGDKGTAKAMSVALRIALIQALNLPTGDPDPDSETYERSSRNGSDSPRRPEERPWRPRETSSGNGQQSRPAARAQDAAPPDGAAEQKWVMGFMERLSDAANADQLRERRGEVSRAVRDKAISPQVANELFTDIQARDREIRGAA